MLLTPHILAGMLFGGFSNDYRYAPLLGLLSYFVLECVPHWDPENLEKTWVKVIRYIDFCVGIITFIIIIFLKQTSGSLSSNGVMLDVRYVLGGIFGALPYFILNLGPLFFRSNRFFAWIKNAHMKIRYYDRSVWGVVIQLSICIICIAILFKLIDFPTWERLRREMYY